MTTQRLAEVTAYGTVANDRERLIRLCVRYTGNVEAAEDLAHESLMAAWRSAPLLRDPVAWGAWLSTIARRRCLHWLRHRERDEIPLLCPDQDGEPRDGPLAELATDAFEVEVSLERAELAELLDRALALLPPQTRTVLVDKYIREMSQAEIAARLGVSEGVVEVRLHRGKRALRHLLTTQFSQEAATYGVAVPALSGGQETRIWCPLCGQRRLFGLLTNDGASFTLRCPGGCVADGSIERTEIPGFFIGLTSPKAAYSRVLRLVNTYYQRSLVDPVVPCPLCSHSVAVRQTLPEGRYGVACRCTACGFGSYAWFPMVVLGLSEGARFWRAHSRMCLLPPREVEVAGHAAVVTSYQSLTSTARLDVISRRDTCAVLAIHGVPDAYTADPPCP